MWDHCHAHGYVRAPLCEPCSTRHWSGGAPSAAALP
ncbi:endonuclease domain-containing protein [Nocardia salmonicida]